MSVSEGGVEHQPDQFDEPSQAGPRHRLSLELPLDSAVGELRLKSEGTLSLSSADLLEARLLSVVASKNVGVWPHLKVDELHVELKDGEVDCERLWTKRFDIVAEGASVQLITAFPDRGGRIETTLGTVNLELRGEPEIQRGTGGDCVVHVQTVHGNVILTTMPITSILRRKHFKGTLSMGSKRAWSRWRRPTFESSDNIGGPSSVVNVLVGSSPSHIEVKSHFGTLDACVVDPPSFWSVNSSGVGPFPMRNIGGNWQEVEDAEFFD